VARVLLAGYDWKFRALLRAQLIEEGVNVEAHETVSDALASLEASEFLPRVFVVDLSSSYDPAGDAEELAKLAGEFPVWIIASHSLIVEETLQGHGFEMILFRPVDIGELVGLINRRVEG